MASLAKPLSDRQKRMIEKLKDGKITWKGTSSSETHSLKSLVRRGLVSVHGLDTNGDYCKDTYWILK